MKRTSPTVRSIKLLRSEGAIVEKVEQKIHMPAAPYPVTRDAFGFGDLLVADPDLGICLVQVTTAGDMNRRIRKIQGIPADPDDVKQIVQAKSANINAKMWIQCHGRIFVHGWAKRGKRGEVKKWTVTEAEIKASDL